MSLHRIWSTACRCGLELLASSRCRLSTWPPSVAFSFICCAAFLKFTEFHFPKSGQIDPYQLGGAVIPASTATTTASLMKGLPVIGTAIGVLTMPVVSAGATWVIGKVFIQHFASGGTLLDFNPPDYREFIKTQREKLGTRPGAVRPAAPSAAPATRSA